MSLHERSAIAARNRRFAALAGFAALVAAVLPGCTVRPLYATQVGRPVTAAGRMLASVAVKPVDTRDAQQVRNQLLFLLYGGAGTPATPVYSLDLGIASSIQTTTRIQRKYDERATSATVSLTSNYRLVEIASGKVVANGRRQTMASFDRPRQEFAAYRAEIDAQDRAARELAEILDLAVAQDIERLAK